MIPKRALLVFGTFLLSVLLYVDRVCISAAEGPITEDLGLTKRQFGWALSAFALGYALCQAPSGWLADRIGPRRVLSAVVAWWSAFTGLTAAAYNFATLLVARFIFGAGEAGAFPGIARATFSWIPMAERGIVQGINFSGSRLGAAFALRAVAWMITQMGWRASSTVLMVTRFLWALFWYAWFRDDPTEHRGIRSQERDFILASRQEATEAAGGGPPLTVGLVARSANVWLISTQYFCSNFTFFFCLTWLFPHMKERYHLGTVEAGLYAAAPLICGALGNWPAGWLVDRIYRSGSWVASPGTKKGKGFLKSVFPKTRIRPT